MLGEREKMIGIALGYARSRLGMVVNSMSMDGCLLKVMRWIVFYLILFFIRHFNINIFLYPEH